MGFINRLDGFDPSSSRLLNAVRSDSNRPQQDVNQGDTAILKAFEKAEHDKDVLLELKMTSVEQKKLPLALRTRMRVDRESGDIVAQILDEKGNIIKQIPPEVMQKLAERFQELQGLLLDEQA
jgi:flagellar protein FlaG